MLIKVTISYDGSKYCGWQKQHHVHSVQAEIERIVSKINKSPTEVVASGRTDKGVHAVAQVFHFELKYQIPLARLFTAFNDLCPEDICATSMEHVPKDFHARFSAKAKHYRYYINTGAYDLFKNDYIYQLNRELDLELMKQAADLFKGKHDFSAFNSTEYRERKNQVRDIKKLDITSENDIIIIDIIADGFLRYMVRMIVGTLVEVGMKRRSLQSVEEMLLSKCKNDFVYNIAPNGLYLMEVFYEEN